MAEPGDVIQPAVDHFRQGDSHHAVVDLAGVSASEVTLRIDDRDAVIQADRPTMTASADDIMLRWPFPYGRANLLIVHRLSDLEAVGNPQLRSQSARLGPAGRLLKQDHLPARVTRLRASRRSSTCR